VLRLVPTICWLIFLAYWIMSARATKTTTERQHRGRELMIRLTMVAGGVLIGFGGRGIGLATPVVQTGIVALQTLGCILCGLGLAVALWARHTLAGNWSSSVTFKEDHELIQRGPYSYARHPIYTGILLMMLGTAMTANQKGALLGVVLVFGGLWWKLRQEEMLMTKHFPETYPAYRQRVKALIPGVL
jgi:protein-S-isoprenylcysteine O-methyltransferase Ste14